MYVRVLHAASPALHRRRTVPKVPMTRGAAMGVLGVIVWEERIRAISSKVTLHNAEKLPCGAESPGGSYQSLIPIRVWGNTKFRGLQNSEN